MEVGEVQDLEIEEFRKSYGQLAQQLSFSSAT